MTTFYPSIPMLTSFQNHVLGCPVFVHVHSPYWGKLDTRAIKCVFICYAPNKKGYKCYHPQSRKVYVSKDVTPFMKQSLSFLVLNFRGRVFKKLRFLSCHLFLCCRIPFLGRMTKILHPHHYQRKIMRTNILEIISANATGTRPGRTTSIVRTGGKNSYP